MTPALRAALLFPSWHPRKLFASADIGTVQNPSNQSAIYQEANAVTAGAVSGAVGLVLDERYSLARGGELVTNGGFSGTTGWTPNTATLGVVDGALEISGAGAFDYAYQQFTTEVGKTYQVTARAKKGTSDSAIVKASADSWATIYQAETSSADFVSLSFAFVATSASSLVFLVTGNTIGTAYFDDVSVKEIPGSHAAQGTAGSRPILRAGGKIDYDGVDDSLVITFPSDMGSACTVGRSVPQGEATILTGQTITTTYTDNTDHCGLVIINRALSATETNQLRRWLNRRAG